MSQGWYQLEEDVLFLNIFLQPGASRTRIVGVHQQRLKIQVQAIAKDNEANQQLLAFLAEQFQVKVAKVKLVSGQHARQKRIKIEKPQELSILYENCSGKP